MKPTNIREKSDKDDEESMSTSGAGTNFQKDNSDEKSSASFETVEEKDTGCLSERNLHREVEKPSTKKQRPDNENCF